MGAGVIPFCVKDEQVHFLFHKTFSGRRAGYLVDFGGGGKESETYRQTALREFIEETETLFFCDDLDQAVRTGQRVESQLAVMETLFDETQSISPDWWCQREPGDKIPPKDWRTYFVEVGYRDVTGMNRAWEADDGSRFSKRRLLIWIPSGELLDIYSNAPERLWKRVRQLQGAEATIRSIVARKLGKE